MNRTQPLLTAPTPAAPPRLDAAAPIVVVHTVFRRELRLAGGVVRRVAAGDRPRAAVVARHLELLLGGLEHHHYLEDEHLWPRLDARVPTTDRPALELMRSQHAAIEGHVAEVSAALVVWTGAASCGDGEHLADRLDAMHADLLEHLDVEERELLPLAERHLTRAEWDAIGRLAEEGTDRSARALVFGMFQYEGDPAVVASMLASAPLPARLLVPRLARRAFRKHALVIHGTATP